MTRLAAVTILLLATASYADDDATRLFPNRADHKDARLGKPKDLNGYFPFTPPITKASWNDRAGKVRTQLLVANGLWPLPEKTPLKPSIHGKIEREGYTVEKVSFASMPGHYVTGNLYRPTAPTTGKRPAVLNPHGHWNNGRFYEVSEANAKKDVDAKGEGTIESARYPLQAKCAMLARLGYVTFLYDMVGYADSTAIPHRVGFTDAAAELRLQSFMGLQTWNTIRALDFLMGLPDVDPAKVAVTGASGGGTQTFILGALDDRPAAAYPAVMVSTAMQGGCICENCSYLRVGTGNVEFAGLFAPRPQMLSGADDWTKEIETKGLPELKALYKTLGVPDKIAGKAWPEFGHNFNQVSREAMYQWFNTHLQGEPQAVKELPFKPIPPKDLAVYDAEHPRPKDELDAAKLREKMTAASDAQMKALEPTDAASLEKWRRTVDPAFAVLLGGDMPKPGALEVKLGPKEVKLPDDITMHLACLGLKGEGNAVPMAGVFGKSFKGDKVVVWIHPKGKASLVEEGKVVPAARALLDQGYAVVAPDTFRTGESQVDKPTPVNPQYAGYTYGYNLPVFANRVRDVLTAVTFARDMLKAKTIHLVGWDSAGPWTVAARAMCGDAIDRTAVDLNQFKFESIKETGDENMLPGAVKYGGLAALLAMAAPGEVFAHNHEGTGSGQLSKAAYDAAKAGDKLKRQPAKASADDVVKWLLRE